MSKKTNCAISQELILVSHANGVKLATPESVFNHHSPSVGSMLQLPFSFYFLNADSATQLINEEGAAVCGFESVKDSLGKTLEDVSSEHNAALLINNCNEVIRAHAAKLYEEKHVRHDHIELPFLSLKMPWYNHHNQVIGVIGCSIVLGRHSLSDSLSKLSSLGFLDQHKFSQPTLTPAPEFKITEAAFSKRELECLKLTLKGLTAKMIAKELGLSFRTVEEYLTNARQKAGVSSKSELIAMMMRDYI